MDNRLTLSRLLAITITGTLSLSASAGGVYKSVGADGTILFSDTPPASDAPIVLQSSTGAASRVTTAQGAPYDELAESDGPVARANAQVDFAEHALALARQSLGAPLKGSYLVAARMTQSDGERVAFYQKDVRIARQQLADSLRDRQSPIQLAVR